MTIPNKPAETPLVPTSFTGATDIYQNTPMIEIPSRMKAWGLAVMSWFTDNNAAGVAKINSAVGNVTDYINNTVVANLNAYQTSLNSNLSALIGTGAGYTIAQVNSFFDETVSNVVYDQNGNITSYKNGIITYSNVVYNSNNLAVSWTKTINIAGFSFPKNYVFDPVTNLTSEV